MDPAPAAPVPKADDPMASLLCAAFDEAPVGMALLALDGAIRRANRALGALLGRPPDALRGLDLAALAHPEDAAAVPAAACLLAEDGLGACHVEQRLARSDGVEVWGLLGLAILRDGRGRPAGLVATVQDVTERKAWEARLRHRALHDPLTGLPNRAFFADRLAQSLAGRRDAGEGVAVLLVDLDGFKAVNDALGHDAGDRLLIAVGQRLAACLRARDVAARVGGDEFALLVEGVRDPAGAAAVANRVLAALRAPVPLGAREAAVTACVGIALGGGGGGTGDLLGAADAALYAAKAAGPGRWITFAPPVRPADVGPPRPAPAPESGPSGAPRP